MVLLKRRFKALGELAGTKEYYRVCTLIHRGKIDSYKERGRVYYAYEQLEADRDKYVLLKDFMMVNIVSCNQEPVRLSWRRNGEIQYSDICSITKESLFTQFEHYSNLRIVGWYRIEEALCLEVK